MTEDDDFDVDQAFADGLIERHEINGHIVYTGPGGREALLQAARDAEWRGRQVGSSHLTVDTTGQLQPYSITITIPSDDPHSQLAETMPAAVRVDARGNRAERRRAAALARRSR